MPSMDELPSVSSGASFALLAGVRVLDLTTSIAGPYASLLLGDLGAEVIKVERPCVGDDARHWGPPFLDGESLWFLSVNRNKRSLALDYARAEGHALLLELVAQSDVVILNQLPRLQAKLGTDYATLKGAREDLIHVALTGFGLTGERADRPCYDLIAEGFSGVMDLTGEAGGPPQKIGTPAADLLAGSDAALAAVAALLDRQRTGRGHQIDVALVESMTRFMSPRLNIWDPASCRGARAPRTACSRSTRCSRPRISHSRWASATTPPGSGSATRSASRIWRGIRALRPMPSAAPRVPSWWRESERSSRPGTASTGSSCSPPRGFRPARSFDSTRRWRIRACVSAACSTE
jgi:hypothetical protein